MKVRELKQKLEDCDDEMVVVFEKFGSNYEITNLDYDYIGDSYYDEDYNLNYSKILKVEHAH